MNYSLCSQEKIEIPGKIQSFGYIIGIDTSFKIQFYSENIYSLFNIDENILDKSIQYIPLISNWLNTININESINITAEMFNINSCLYYIDLKFHNNQYHISLEKIVKTENVTGSRILEIDHYDNIINYEDLWNNLLKDIHHKIGYDRMMIYQFLEDGSGKVIAEKKISSVESFLNLHYPKNDIPEQAKNLYLKQKRRIFSNVNSKEILLVSKHKDIDLSYFDSRSMSSIHRQYLINTNIESSFSTSIIIDGKLWGLVTCQNNSYKHIDLRDRIYSELLTNWVSKSYSILRSKNRNDYNQKIDKEIFEIKKNISFCDDINIGIKDNLNNFIDLVEADGAVFVNDDKILKKGHTPSNVKILDIINWYKNNFINENEIHIDRSFAFKNPNLVDDLKVTAGIVINEINREQKKYLIWFRKEFVDHINWAGNPEKDISYSKINGLNFESISPRKSFEIFKQETKGKSLPWTSQNKLVINKIQSLFFELIFYHYIKIKELNEELNLKNEELDSFSYTLSHDLGTPLTVIKLNLQQLYIKLKDQEDSFNKIKTILDQVSNMESLMQNILNISRLKTTDIIYEEVDMNYLISRIIEDCIKVYGINTKVGLDIIPNIKADKTLIYQVFQNVISNAIKYSSEGIEPVVKIKGADEPNYTIYTISDNGIGIPENQINDLFKIFKRLDNAKTYQGNGVGLAIVNRIMSRLNGKIEVINNQKRGTTFKLYFKKK